MRDLRTKDVIELASLTATVSQLNVIIKARDMRIVELERENLIIKGHLCLNSISDSIDGIMTLEEDT